MKKTLLIVLPSLFMCAVIAALICIAVFWDFGNGDGTDNLIHPHELTLVEEKQATCMEEGHSAYYFCAECDKWFSDADGKNEITDRASIIIEGTHNFVNGECLECGVEHDCDYSSSVTPPTCTEAGFTTYECDCGLSYVGNYTEPVGHDYNYSVSVTPPTCTEQGFTTYQCVCGLGYKDDYKQPEHDYFNGKCRICGSEHDCKYADEVTPPTCTERGFTAHTCACGNSYRDSYTPTLGHEYTDGICIRCGKIFGAAEFKFYGSYYMCSGIDSAFEKEDVTELFIPSSYNGYPVKGIENNAFEQCVNLTKVTLNDGIISIGDYAFHQCKLTSITIPDSVESIGAYAFLDCVNLESVKLSDNLKRIGVKAFNGCTSLTDICLPDSVASIGEAAFSGCTSLNSVTLSYGLKAINIWMFYDCPALTEVIIPDSVQIIYTKAFSKCSNLTTVSIPVGLTNIYRHAFSYTSLTDIYYGGTVEQWLEINKGENWDAECDDYTVHCTDGDYSKKYTYGLRYTLSDDGSYYICSGIGTATDNDIVIAATYNFIPVRAIGERAFMNCENLTGITIPEGVTSIGSQAFQSCTGLLKIVIPDSVTKIDNYAFYGCSSLKEITVPAGVTALESYTFTNCTKLERIIYKGTMDEWNAIPHTGWLYLNNCTIVCTDGQFKSGHI